MSSFSSSEDSGRAVFNKGFEGKVTQKPLIKIRQGNILLHHGLVPSNQLQMFFFFFFN